MTTKEYLQNTMLYNILSEIYKHSSDINSVRMAKSAIDRIELLEGIEIVFVDSSKTLPIVMQSPLTNSSGLDLNFETKEELLKKAFELYGSIMTTDEILDICKRIWGKTLEN